MRRADEREGSGVPGVTARYAQNQPRIWLSQAPLTTPRSAKGPPPLAVTPMLGLTRRLRQANADREAYDFSLSSPILAFFQAFAALPLETVICEQHPLDARDRMADRCPLFSIRGQIGRPRTACGGCYDFPFAWRHRASPLPMEQPLLQRAPGEGLRRLRQGSPHLLAAFRLLYLARALLA